jgi:hypothetical protein
MYFKITLLIVTGKMEMTDLLKISQVIGRMSECRPTMNFSYSMKDFGDHRKNEIKPLQITWSNTSLYLIIIMIITIRSKINAP